MSELPPCPIRLRAHHVLCVAGFRGKGYCAPFVAAMDRIVRALRRWPDLPVTIVHECDDICQACPHREGGRCAQPGANETIRERDRHIAQALGIQDGQRLAARALYGRVAECAPAAGGIEGLCGACQWRHLPYCDEGLADVVAGRFFTSTPAQPDASPPDDTPTD